MASPVQSAPLRLESGEMLDRPTFHRRYARMPDGFRAELVEGMVIVNAAASFDHGNHDGAIAMRLRLYRAATPGTRSASNATVILGPHTELQPDGMLLIEPACGGKTRRAGQYVAGPPELTAEISNSSTSHDLHGKYREYERAGVLEYLVALVRERRVAWFHRSGKAFVPLVADGDGVFRSRCFPGLWLNEEALFGDDDGALIATLEAGLAGPEHAAFVKRLAATKRRKGPNRG